jgi:hypothetical protein
MMRILEILEFCMECGLGKDVEILVRAPAGDFPVSDFVADVNGKTITLIPDTPFGENTA